METVQQVIIVVKGIVQGVGFRPFVYRLAKQCHLLGTVLNNHQGVTIELQGLPNTIKQFIETLATTPPPLARIDSIEQHKVEALSAFTTFSIIESTVLAGEHANVAVSADKSVCQDCLDEMHNPRNRHYLYPFTNCTNCGPRYTIVKALPYDRCHTAMAHFDMCATCKDAYLNPLNRRYHAQPVSCPECGPQLQLSILNSSFSHNIGSDPLTLTAQLIKQGAIVAIKGLGGFHLVCDATNDQAVRQLRLRKQRPAKPLAIMARDLNQAQLCVCGDASEWDVLNSAERPIVLMRKHTENPLGLSEQLAPGIDRLGVFLPYTPLHHLLMSQLPHPIVATSANRSGEPIIGNKIDIEQQLASVVDAILDHNRDIVNACDDSVVQVIDKQVQVIRLARGYAPLTININPENEANFAHSPVLAVGAQQKNTIALGFDHCIMLSPHIGDLYSLEAQQYFHQTLATFKRLYAVTPSYIVHDKHPQYTPSQWACNYQQQHALPAAHCISVQHHYAHVLSVMAVNQHTDTVLGISFDGTGLGDDGVLWGSEVMLADIHGYRTLAHFSEFSLIGGEQAIKQPERILLALLFEHLSVEHILTLPINAIHHLGENTVRNLYTLWRNNRHCIPCRSVGRLFDALAVGLNLLEQNQYEGQAGMMIETAANLYLKRKTHPNTGHEINNNGAQTITLQRITTVQSGSSTITWNSSALITELVTAAHHTNNPLAESTPENAHIQQVCWHFMAQIAEQIDVISRDYRHIPMVFCGGVFQNKTLLNQCLTNAQFNQHPVLASQYVPINDGGIALGQLWYGLQRFMPKTSQTTPVTI